MTGPHLHAARYNTARTSLEEFFERPARIGVRCALPGWLQRLEVTVKANSRVDAYERYRTHQGDGFALLDSYLDKPIVGGWVYEVVPDNRHVHYVCAGPWKRHTDEYETDNPTIPGQASIDYLQNSMLTHVPAIDVVSANIESNNTDMGGFKVDENTGTTPQDFIQDWLLPVGNNSNQVMDYWCEERQFDGVALQAPVPFLQARDTSASIDWQVQRRDLASMEFARHIYDLVNDVKLWFDWYTQLDGAHAEDDGTITVDSIANFAAGHEIEIELDDGRTHRTFIDGAPSGSTITLKETLPHSAPDDAFVFKVKPLQDTSAATDSDSQSDFWTREHRQVARDIQGSDSDQAQINQLRSTLLQELKQPVQQASFRIGSRWVRDGAGARWPLWRMLHRPGYVRINDLFPAASLLDLSIDNLRAFWTAALDYDHSSRVMTVTPDAFLGDNRIDVLLQRAGLGIGQIVERAPAQAGPQM